MCVKLDIKTSLSLSPLKSVITEFEDITSYTIATEDSFPRDIKFDYT